MKQSPDSEVDQEIPRGSDKAPSRGLSKNQKRKLKKKRRKEKLNEKPKYEKILFIIYCIHGYIVLHLLCLCSPYSLCSFYYVNSLLLCNTCIPHVLYNWISESRKLLLMESEILKVLLCGNRIQVFLKI